MRQWVVLIRSTKAFVKILYLVYTNDLPIQPKTTLSLYADDAMYQY